MIVSSKRIKDEFVGELLLPFLKYRILKHDYHRCRILAHNHRAQVALNKETTPRQREKMTYMRSDRGTRTQDIGRMDQDMWMGYNHVNPAVSLAGHGTCGRSLPSEGRT